MILTRKKAEDVPRIRRDPVEPRARAVAEPIVAAVLAEGEVAVRRYAEQFKEIEPGAKIVMGKEELRAAFDSLDAETRAMLERTGARIRSFAAAQRASITEVT